MNKQKVRKLLEDIRSKEIEIDEALERLRALPYEDLGFAKIDTHRDLRKGFPEVIFCKGKTVEQITAIVERMAANGQTVMATKADRSVYDAIVRTHNDVAYNEAAQIVLVGEKVANKTDKVIVVVSAGTSDIPVAEEAVVTASAMGNPVETLYDVGVAGVHRLLDNTEKLFSANVVIVVAGMEGALATVVGGLVDKPVIAVPTSVGYGASFNGLSALLSMLNCCAPGVAVVNIDNGFGAGYFAGVINLLEG